MLDRASPPICEAEKFVHSFLSRLCLMHLMNENSPGKNTHLSQTSDV